MTPGITLGPPDPATRAEIDRLARAAALADGREPFSEQTGLLLATASPQVTHVVRRAGDTVAGYGQRDATGTAELAVHPDHRRAGHGRAVLDALSSVRKSSGDLRIWSHAGHPGAEALARASGLVAVRKLWRMSRDLPLDADADPPGEVALPPGIRVRTFVPGQDEAPWLALNTVAFATHGEQGRLTRADLDARLAAPWFRPDGFFLAEQVAPATGERAGPAGDGSGDRGGRLIGFHWTKEHPPGPNGEPPAGEIYVLGVDPATHGGGLGRALSRIGLRHLAGRGLGRVLLYVDAGNTAATAVYLRLGFRTESISVMYADHQQSDRQTT